MAIGSLYLIAFWSAAGQTPGMRFVGVRLNEHRLRPGRSLRRLFGLYLSVVTFGFGFLGIVFRESRRGWEDRFSGTDVLYDERRPEPAPWAEIQRCTHSVALPEAISRVTLMARTISAGRPSPVSPAPIATPR